MIPFYLILGLNSSQLLLYLAIQTIFSVLIFNLLLYFGLHVLLKDKNLIEIRAVIKTSIFIEICNSIFSFAIYLFVNLALPGLIMYLFLFFSAPFIILYMRYYEKDKISEIKTILLYLISYPGTFISSIALTSAIFGLIGINVLFLFGSP